MIDDDDNQQWQTAEKVIIVHTYTGSDAKWAKIYCLSKKFD